MKHFQKTHLLNETLSKRGTLDKDIGKASIAYSAAMVLWRKEADADLLAEAERIASTARATTYEAHIVRNLQKDKGEWQSGIRKYKAKYESEVPKEDITPAIYAVIEKRG